MKLVIKIQIGQLTILPFFSLSNFKFEYLNEDVKEVKVKKVDDFKNQLWSFLLKIKQLMINLVSYFIDNIKQLILNISSKFF